MAARLTTAQVLQRLRALLAQGATLRGAARRLSRTVGHVYRLAVAHDLPRRRRHLPAAKRQRIARLLARGHSPPAIARVVQVNRSTVWKHARRLAAAEDPSLFVRVKAWRCPRHRWVRYRPCVACAAEAAWDHDRS